MQVSYSAELGIDSTLSRNHLRVLLVYPNTRDVAMANLGFQQVYSLLNNIEGVVCDRFALPVGWQEETQSLGREELRSMDLRLHPLEFDVIAFSISFEPDYLNTVLALKYFGIPLDREERDASFPMITAGGSAIFINPEPLAECMDVLFIGEGEGMAENFFGLLGEDLDRDQFFERAVFIPGIYLPQHYRPRMEKNLQVEISPLNGAPDRVVRHWVTQEESLCTHSVLHDEDSTFKDMALMEVTRGCIWACRFFTAGFIYRPPRLPDLDKT